MSETAVPPTQPPDAIIHDAGCSWETGPDCNCGADPERISAAPETETDANGLTDHRPVLALALGHPCIVGCACLSARDYRAAGHRGGIDGWMSHLSASLTADLDAARERVRVVEGERDDIADRLSDVLCEFTRGKLSKSNYSARTMIQAIEAEFTEDVAAIEDRAESAEAAHAALVAAVEALADEWGQETCICDGMTPNAFAVDLRALLAGGAR